MAGDLIPVERIQRIIFLIRGQRVMLSMHLAELYGVQPKVLMQAVKRNMERFPEDFMFQLNREEWDILKSQFVTSSWGGIRRGELHKELNALHPQKRLGSAPFSRCDTFQSRVHLYPLWVRQP